MPTASTNRHAFTLLELLIVVVLIATLYGVFINRMSQSSARESTDGITLKTLQKRLGEFPAGMKREIVCTRPCKACRIYLNGTPLKEGRFSLFDAPPTVFSRDRFGQLRPVTFMPLRDEEGVSREVCFRYELFRNGSGSSYVVQTDEKHYYIYKPYLFPVRVVASLSEAQKAFDTEALLPTERRNYNF